MRWSMRPIGVPSIYPSVPTKTAAGTSARHLSAAANAAAVEAPPTLAFDASKRICVGMLHILRPTTYNVTACTQSTMSAKARTEGDACTTADTRKVAPSAQKKMLRAKLADTCACDSNGLRGVVERKVETSETSNICETCGKENFATVYAEAFTTASAMHTGMRIRNMPCRMGDVCALMDVLMCFCGGCGVARRKRKAK